MSGIGNQAFSTVAGILTMVLALIGSQSCEPGSFRISLPERELKQAIVSVLDDQVVAWNNGDIEGFMAGYENSPDIIFTSGGVIRRGWAAVLEKYKSTYTKEPMGRLTFSETEITPLGQEGALVVGRWKLEREDDSPNGVFTLVLKPTPDGWRIIHDHTSLTPDDG